MRFNVINNRSIGDKGYQVTFMDQTVGVYAGTESQAKQIGIEYFKPKKKLRNTIEVEYVARYLNK